MLNEVILQGRLASEIALRKTAKDVPVCSVRLAVERDYKDRETGEKQTDFVTVVAWRQTAEFMAKYLKKGVMVLVEGRLQTRQIEDGEGKPRQVVEVVAERVYPLEKRQAAQEEVTFAPLEGEDENLPFSEVH